MQDQQRMQEEQRIINLLLAKTNGWSKEDGMHILLILFSINELIRLIREGNTCLPMEKRGLTIIQFKELFKQGADILIESVKERGASDEEANAIREMITQDEPFDRLADTERRVKALKVLVGKINDHTSRIPAEAQAECLAILNTAINSGELLVKKLRLEKGLVH